MADHLDDFVRGDRVVDHARAETNVRATGGGWVLAHSATARSAIEDEHVRAEVRLCLLAHPRVVEDALLLVLEDLLGPIAQFVGAFHKKSGGETGVRLTRNRVPLLLRPSLADGAHRQRLVVVGRFHLFLLVLFSGLHYLCNTIQIFRNYRIRYRYRIGTYIPRGERRGATT